jgi:hypothetical protein
VRRVAARAAAFTAAFALGACQRHAVAPSEQAASQPPTSAPSDQISPALTPPPAPPPAAVSTPTTAPPAPPALRELFPLVRADLSAKIVEFDGIVPINCHDPATPDVYLELVACTPDTREHESLVMTKARPSHVHAALLAIGLQPGKPGAWKFENKKLLPIPPEGDGLALTLVYHDASGKAIECPVTDWIINARDGSPFAPRDHDETKPRWVFAGSVMAMRQGKEVYDADGAGTFIGLCTFGSEVIAWRDTISPEAMIEEPVWIADPKKVPAAGTPVTVRIRPAR